MKAIIQRISESKVEIDGTIFSSVGAGILVLIAFAEEDGTKEIDWMINKIINLRVFGDDDGKMNLSVLDLNKDIMIVSNFTVYGDSKKGFRPSYIKSASNEKAKKIWDNFISQIKSKCSLNIQTGSFGADMQVHLVNDGPVTVIIETN